MTVAAPVARRSTRILELDGMRGLAVLAVVLFHVQGDVMPYGWLGVDLFFVLSGYLITTILLTEGERPGGLWRFYKRRALRIWPIYYLMVLASAAAAFAIRNSYPARANFGGLPYYLLYLQGVHSYWGGETPAIFPGLGHTWTLAIEEQFYLIWPFVVRLCGRKWLAPASALLCVVSVVYRLQTHYNDLLLGHADGLALGSLLAVVLLGLGAGSPWIARLRRGGLVGAALSLVLILAVPLNGAKKDWLILAAAFLFFCLTTTVLLSEGASWLAPLRVRWLTQLGVISYGVYLYHVPIMLGFEVALRRIGISHPFGVDRPWWRAGLEMTTTLTVALLSWRFIERPILRLR